MGMRNRKTSAKGRTRLGSVLEQSAKEILAHVKGESKLPARRIVLPDEVDVKRIRTKRECPKRSLRAHFASTRGRYRNGSKAAEHRTQPPARTQR